MGGPDKSGLSFGTTYVLSAVSSVVAETLTFPADMVKTRLQIQGEGGTVVKRGFKDMATGIVREEVGHTHHNQHRREALPAAWVAAAPCPLLRASSLTGFLQCLRRQGVMGLYKGLAPACLRHVVYSGSRVMVYEFIREKVLLKDADGKFALWKGALAGMSAGIIGQAIASPTDLVKVQMQADGRRVLAGHAPRYKGPRPERPFGLACACWGCGHAERNSAGNAEAGSVQALRMHSRPSSNKAVCAGHCVLCACGCMCPNFSCGAVAAA